MMLLDDMRAEFARFLATDPQGRWRMDKALGHVITLAYERGMEDGRQAHIESLHAQPADGDQPGHLQKGKVPERRLGNQARAGGDRIRDFVVPERLKVGAGGTAEGRP